MTRSQIGPDERSGADAAEVVDGAPAAAGAEVDGTRTDVLSADGTRTDVVSADGTRADVLSADGTRTDVLSADGTGADADTTDAALGAAVGALAGELEPAQRRNAIARLVQYGRQRGVGELFKPRSAGRWMADTITDIAPHIPIRDRETLRRHFSGLDTEALAERLIRNAARATASVGAAGGGVASIEWVAPPTLLSAPVLLAAETVAVVGIEIKLIGELHQVYGVQIPGSRTQQAVALVQSWAGQRGVNPMVPGVGVAAVLSTAARKELRDMLLRRFGRNLTTLAPLLTGAAVASYLNRRATRGLGDRLREDLRQRPTDRPALPQHPATP